MFGYVKIAEEELRVREWKVYKSYYCGLCKNIAEYSQLARLMLSYDMVFLALLIESGLSLGKSDCNRKIFKRCKKACGDRRLDYIAAVSIIFLYFKLQNDYYDGERKKRYLMYAIKSGYGKAADAYPFIANKIEESMKKLYQLEKQKCCDFLELEHCFADCFAEVFRGSELVDEYGSVRGQIAYHVAAWVYWFDMCQDIEKDRTSGDFNAILLCTSEADGKKRVEQMLLEHITAAEKLVQTLPYTTNVEIIQNIVAIGIPAQMKRGNVLI